MILPTQIDRVLITGGRDFLDVGYVFRKLNEFRALCGFSILMHGECPSGADALADRWCFNVGVHVCRCPALWDFFKSQGKGRAAGVIRNRAMLTLHPQLVIAFPGDKGTADMLKVARSAQLPTLDLADDYRRVSA